MDNENQRDTAPAPESSAAPKKKNVLIIVLAAVIGLVSAGLLGFLVLVGTNGIAGLDGIKKPFTPILIEDYGPPAPTATTPLDSDPQATEPQVTEPLNLKSYTVSDEEAAAVVDQVIATVGQQQLTNGILQPYYKIAIQAFIESNYFYLYQAGIDLNQPLDQLVFDPETNQTWQEYMLEGALQTWQMYSALYEFGATSEEYGYQLSEVGQEYVKGLPQMIEDMAAKSGFATAEEFVKDRIGATASVEGMLDYMEKEYYYLCYYSYLQEKLNPTMEQIEEFFTKNELAYANRGITKEGEDVVNFRHILITPKSETEGENAAATFTEEEWEQARVRAQGLLNTWQNGTADESAFMDLVSANTDDVNTKSNGGLYTGIMRQNMNEEMSDWCFAEGRAYGETALIKAEDGYHVIFFISEEPQWVQMSREDYIAQTIYKLLEDVMAQYPLEVDYDKIALSN